MGRDPSGRLISDGRRVTTYPCAGEEREAREEDVSEIRTRLASIETRLETPQMYDSLDMMVI